jgi:hypothetical protein
MGVDETTADAIFVGVQPTASQKGGKKVVGGSLNAKFF